jgi:hypothetical protein
MPKRIQLPDDFYKHDFKQLAKIENCYSQNIKFQTNEALRSLDTKLKDFGTFTISTINLNFKLSQRIVSKWEDTGSNTKRRLEAKKSVKTNRPSGKIAQSLIFKAFLPDGNEKLFVNLIFILRISNCCTLASGMNCACSTSVFPF